ncbi:hypothetical protein [Enterovibrio paralichthyis]|nr:hypothetical protein [Enterovibrio paralichthyis]MBV7300302.1 hypothetical protein [Enterovibrio paralichthyis]
MDFTNTASGNTHHTKVYEIASMAIWVAQPLPDNILQQRLISKITPL